MGNSSTSDNVKNSEYLNEGEENNSASEIVSAIPWLSNTCKADMESHLLTGIDDTKHEEPLHGLSLIHI